MTIFSKSITIGLRIGIGASLLFLSLTTQAFKMPTLPKAVTQAQDAVKSTNDKAGQALGSTDQVRIDAITAEANLYRAKPLQDFISAFTSKYGAPKKLQGGYLDCWEFPLTTPGKFMRVVNYNAGQLTASPSVQGFPCKD